MNRHAPERIETIVVGGGQAGLASGYHLARAGLPFLILDAHHRVGDSWRTRWDSMRLLHPGKQARAQPIALTSCRSVPRIVETSWWTVA